jgi:hypothetical protein
VVEPENRKQVEGLKRASLRGLTRTFLADAARMGLGPDEVGPMIEKLLEYWRATGSPPDDGEPD